MGRIRGTSRIVGVAGGSGGHASVGGSLRRGRAPRPSATWLGCALGVVASALTAAIAVQIAGALQRPGFGGFPPIP